MYIIDSGIKSINKKKVAFFKFITKAIDQNIFNYYFFTILEGKVLMFTFNCIEKLRSRWEKSADEIVLSLNIK